MWAYRGKDAFWIALSYVGDGPQDARAQWVIYVNYDPGLNLIKRLFHTPSAEALLALPEHVQHALTSNAAISVVPDPYYGR